MTPLKLELQGFTVFREAVSVELEGLELFAISGPTGAGKSTLLDALTYALYGQTARLGRTGLDVLISPGSAQMSVVLAFRSARGTYRVTRTADRKPSGAVVRNTRVERLGSDAKWTQLAESEKLKEADAKLEEIVGLDYDGFTRSVLLPQGAFDEFLRGDSTKRRKLLVNLLGLDRVEEMQRKAGRLAREAEALGASLKVRLEQDYAGATPERVRDLKKELRALVEERDALSARQIELAQDLKELDEVKRLVDEQRKVQTEVAELKAQEGEMRTSRRKLEHAKRARLVAPQIEMLRSAQAKLKRVQDELAKGEALLKSKRAELDGVQAALDKARHASETRLPDIEAKLTALAGVTPLLNALTSRGGRLELAEKAEPDTLYSDLAWDDQQRSSAQLPALVGAETALIEAKRELEGKEKSLQTLSLEVKSLQDKLNLLEQQGKQKRTAEKAAAQAYETAVDADKSAELREHLHVGEACPVCTQTVTTLPPRRESRTTNLKKTWEEAKAALDELVETYRETRTKLETAKARAEDQSAALEAAQKKVLQLETSLDTQRQAFASLGVTDSAAIRKALERRKTLLLAALAAQVVARSGGVDPREAQQALQTEKRSLETVLKAAETAFQTTWGAFDRLSTQAEMLTRQSTELQGEIGGAQKALAQSLQQAEFASAAEAQEALLTEAQTNVLEARLKTFEMRREGAERRDVELMAQLAGRTLDEARYRSLKEEEATLATTLAELQKSQGRLERDLSNVAEALEKAKTLRDQLATAASRFDLYRLLALDLRGNEFQEYLLAQVQAKLARRASHILRDVTEGRYDLRLEDGDYVVRDAWATGELRNAKTLSGGETFIASLALALALSDTIAGSHALGALFLDEGFGTLDPDMLSSVAGVLENLTREGRMVGVITHVKELTERLPARLTVSKGVAGSTLSWDL